MAGLILTFVGIYAHNHGAYTTLSIASVAVTGSSTVICGFLAAFYSFWLLRRLKHEREREQSEQDVSQGCYTGREMVEVRQLVDIGRAERIDVI